MLRSSKKYFDLFYDKCVDTLIRLETVMKIHTTQNLSALEQQQTTNSVSIKEFRLNEKENPTASIPYYLASGVSFGKKRPSARDAKNIVNTTKKAVEEVKKKGEPEKKKIDKLIKSKFFDKLLKVAEHETVVQGAMSALICIIFRPITIMALPNRKGNSDKQNNMYASAHSMSSGIMSLLSSLIVAQPFKNGAKHVMTKMYQDLKTDALERLAPHLNIKSIWKDEAKGIRKPIEEWLDKSGNRFIPKLKDVHKIPKFKQFAEISEESFDHFGANVDWAANKGKSFNDVITKDGKSLYDAIDWEHVGIKVSNEGMEGEASVLIKNLDKDFLAKIIKDSPEGSNWSKLDIKSVYNKNGLVKDFRQWKDLDGNQWKLDLDSSYISSVFDTADYIPVITGKTRDVLKKDGTVKETKYITYLKNGRNGKLGTEISQEMVNADLANEVHDKILTWLPDIVTRPFIAAGTIALIPLALKHIFGLEKPKKEAPVIQQQAVQTETQGQADDKKVSFNGSKEKGASWLTRMLAKIYGKPLYESDKLNKASKVLSGAPGSMTQHMATLGSLITSSVYVEQTLTKKDLDSDRRRTLAINQILCFIIPTICAYTVDKLIGNWVKNTEYRYSGLQERQMDIKTLKGEKFDRKALEKDLGTKLRGVRTLATLATFTLIYRYVTPVLITPIANMIGDKITEKKKAEAQQTPQTMKVDFNAERTADNSSQKSKMHKVA